MRLSQQKSKICVRCVRKGFVKHEKKSQEPTSQRARQEEIRKSFIVFQTVKET